MYDSEFDGEDVDTLRARITELEAENRDLTEANGLLQAEAGAMRDALEHIAEYWNGSQNDRAMSDALDEIVGTANKALSTTAGAAMLRVVKAVRECGSFGLKNCRPSSCIDCEIRDDCCQAKMGITLAKLDMP